MPGLVLYNTRTRAKQAFESLEAGHARIYTCGPTVYAPPHIGNLRSNLFADLLKRALLLEGYRVTHVINVTDVGHLTDDADAGEDKIERAAAEAGKGVEEIADIYTRQWLSDRDQTGCLPPEVICKATEHIDEQVEMVRVLEEKGFTYRIDDGIYFDTSKFAGYAEFANLNLAGQESGARIGDVPGKKHPSDFALWKFPAPSAGKRLQEWGSPWGIGFPGWHLECSAMSSKYLGTRFDIHTGGVDHIAVHHTNEIAQSECCFDVHPWVQFWLHNEFLDLRGEKMSKSKGNVTVLDDLVAAGYPARAFRYFFLQAHYRQQQVFTDAAMEAAATGYDRLVNLAAEVREAPGPVDDEKLEPLRERFRVAYRDDLNGPRALAVAWEAARGGDLTAPERWALLRGFDEFLGLDLAHAEGRTEVSASDPRIDALVAARQAARAARDFAEADRIRDELAAEGIAIEDTPAGPRWRRQ
jgi:cysteinyl-tRNA synthetase